MEITNKKRAGKYNSGWMKKERSTEVSHDAMKGSGTEQS